MKKILFLMLLIGAANSSAAIISSGDSITAGSASTSGNAYVARLGQALRASISNYAVSGDQAADQAIRTYGVNLGTGDRATVMIGTNDQWRYLTSTYKRSLYQSFLTSIVANIVLPTKVNANSSAVTYTGTWSSSQPTWSKGKMSSSPGSTATTTVSGTSIYIGVIRQDDINRSPINGTANVFVDGILVGSIGSAATGMTTQNGDTYAPAAYRFSGLSSGAHTVKVVITSVYSDYRGILYLEYFAGSAQTIKPDVYVSTIPRYSPVGYASVGGSDANMAVYNSIISKVVTNFIADGAAVHQVDVNSKLNQSTDLASDGIHPLNLGHAKIFGVFYHAITGISFN